MRLIIFLKLEKKQKKKQSMDFPSHHFCFIKTKK